MSECEKIRPRLAAFLHGEVEDPESIQAHLDSCPECARMLDAHRKITRLAGLVTDLSPCSDAWTKVETRISSSPDTS